MRPARPSGHCPTSPRLTFLTERPFAHRGLHGVGRPENSLAAARAAIGAGFGIECDVRLSRDGIAHVFHDARLDRLTDSRGRFAALDSSAIARLRLAGTNEAPPRLATLLALCGSATPLLVELKSEGGPQAVAQLCAAVAADLAGHDGPAAVMSFDVRVCHWFARHRPQIVRGLVTSRRYRMGVMARRTKKLALARARPHFLASDVRDLSLAASRAPCPDGRPLLCWTVRSEADRRRAARAGAQIIFENEAT